MVDNEYWFKLVNGNFYLGEKITVEFDGKLYTRVVRDRRDCGMYIVINNEEFYMYKCDFGDN